MYKYYSPEKEKEYGVLGIKIKLDKMKNDGVIKIANLKK